MSGAFERLIDRIEATLRALLGAPERTRRLYPALLLVFTLLIWFPSLFTGINPANPDDFYHITQAALHHTPQDVLGWFQRGYWAYSHYEYRPLTRLSLLVDYFIWGRRPFGYHLGNVLLHFACALLLAAVMSRAGAPIWAARLSGVIAVLFPTGQMAVSWITGRQDVLCAVLLMGAILQFVSWLRGGSWARVPAAAALTLLAALAKEPGAAVPLFLLAAAFLVPTRRSALMRLLAVAAVAVALAPYAFVRFHAWSLGDYADANAPQLRPIGVGVRHFFASVLLPAPYDLVTRWRIMGLYVVLSPGFIWMLLGQVAFWSALVVLLRRQRRLLALGVMWKIVFFLPVFNLYWNPAFTHYRYLPHLGTAWIAGLAAWELSGWAAALLRRWGRPAVRWALVGAGLLTLLLHYRSQLDLKWAPVSFMLKGGHPPPEAFCRDLHGADSPFDVVDSDPGAP